ncbi:MAG: FAD-dependent oxidoreductase [Saprospiraceae bacterium]|nr:FAD-dependent oxidoreductase [Saprospiraceae bacterium]
MIRYLRFTFVITCCLILLRVQAQKEILLEAESFKTTGGWVIDQQFFDVMGSSYLLAHGLGHSVADAASSFQVQESGTYQVWVRTKDWAPFPKGPGKFILEIGDHYQYEFGSTGKKGWQWYKGGEINLSSGQKINIRLHDMTGFDGRCDAIFLTTDLGFTPPEEGQSLSHWRRELLGLPETPMDAGLYDLVVIGGGMAGTCTALSAARQGLKVALVQNRPVLGGNNSSEIRVHLMGRTDKNDFPVLGRIVHELDNGDPGNANSDGDRYGDDRKEEIVRMQPNLDLFLSMHAYDVEMKDHQITAVIARHIQTNEELRFPGRLFADCTGDGTIGYLAGADYRMGRESKEETGEDLAPEKSDSFTLGTSNLWHASVMDTISSFPETPWALTFTDEYYIDAGKADWQWETGFGNFNTITEAEEIRDHNFRAIYGNWSFLKNEKKDKYQYHQLDWVAHIGGKRESRRLMGDYVLNQYDCQGENPQDDGFVTATWTIDLHFPDPENKKYFEGEEFFAATKHIRVAPYNIPYRCLYSRNIDNLFMAGRNISTTHVAFGSTRVMKTCGMMGELVGYAAGLCKKYDVLPRQVYEKHLAELTDILKGVRMIRP